MTDSNATNAIPLAPTHLPPFDGLVAGMPDPQAPVLSSTTISRPDAGPLNHLFYPALDGLRAIAFLMVFGQHYLDLSWGWTGVDIFFVLSGFLITGILFDTQDNPRRVQTFYIRRTLRIFPLYYALFLLLLLSYPYFKWRIDATWLVWPAYLGNFARFIHAAPPDTPLQLLEDAQPLSRAFPHFRLYLGHLWSLCVEEQFYLFWPWIVFWVRDRRRLIAICIAFVLATPVLRVVASHHLPAFMLQAEVLNRVTLFQADALLLGGLLALILRAGHGLALLKTARFVFAGCVLSFALWLAFNPYARTLQLRTYPAWRLTWGLTFINLFAAALIVMALQPGSWTYNLLSLKPLRWIGRISYGAYVFHDIPKALYYKLLKPYPEHRRITVALLGLACTLIFAWLSFRFFESPFISLKQRWSRPNPAAPPTNS